MLNVQEPILTGSGSSKTRTRWTRSTVVSQSSGETVSPGPDHMMSLDNVVDSCSTDLALGNANVGELCLEVKPLLLGTCRSPEERVNNLIKPLSGILPGGMDTFTCVGDKPCHRKDCSANRHDTLFTASLDAPIKVSCPNETSGLYPKVVCPVTSQIMSESAKRPKVDDRGDRDVGFASVSEKTFLSLPTLGINEHNDQVSKKNIALVIPHLDGQYYRHMYDAPPLLKELVTPMKDGQHQSLDIHTRHDDGSQIQSSTPPNLSLSISVSGNSPESMLRSLAMNYKNTPSIIGKQTFKEGSFASDSHHICIPAKTISCVNDKSLERRLENAFDMEWDPASVRHCTPVSSIPLSEVNFGANVMLAP